ncbi:MAG: ImmA/IrrE family metallo-endopeptidase [Anaerolineae bacterium]
MIVSSRFMRQEEIEARALATLKGYEERFGQIQAPPVPIESLVEKYLDLWIEWGAIEDDAREPILARIYPSGRIFMNENRREHFEEYWGSEQFTLAHEVGHWDLHVHHGAVHQLTLPEMDPAPVFICRWNKRDRIEWQANRYASFLLMPDNLVRKVVSGLDLTRWPVLYDVRDCFGVSITALKIRLEEMGLIYVDEAGSIYRSEQEYAGQRVLL